MINRIAKAMQSSPAWPAVFDAGTAETLARVALERVREPTDKMVHHGEGYSDFTLPPAIGSTRNDLRREMRMAYRAMIDAALFETT